MVPVELASLIINERSDEQVMCLREVGGERQLPIIIGVFEAGAIDRSLSATPAPRPLTHDLLGSVIAQLGASLARVVIDDREGDTFFAKLVLRRGSEEVYVDARPSDALALALKQEVPIYVAEKVIDRATAG